MRRRIGVAALAAILASVLFAPGASAAVKHGYINGTGVVTDDWGDEGVLARDTFPYSNASGLWQEVLYADGELAKSDIDCIFGPNTEAATKRWQSKRGLVADGRVGIKTFGKADDKLSFHDIENLTLIRYNGTDRDIIFRRVNSRYHLATIGAVAYYRQRSPACD